MQRRWRPLGAGEIAMASLLFRDAIDYAGMRVFSQRRTLPDSRIGELLPHHWISAGYFAITVSSSPN